MIYLMASTLASSGLTDSEPPSSCSRSLFSCCLDWVSVFISRRSMVSNSMASTSDTTGCIDSQNEAFQGRAPPASTSVTSGCNPEREAFQEMASFALAPFASTSGTSGSNPENEEMDSFQEMTPPAFASSPAIPENEAFEGMAPSASAMGRSSTLIQKQSYDVFINHRGPDVKKTLATRIYDILDNMKVKAFLDSKELEPGDFLPQTLQTTIRGATLHIAIFSERYAESAWCLEELSLMVRSGAKIIPIFYRVEPADLRYGKGVYVAAFNKHTEKGRYKPEKLKEWKDALYKVSFYTGEFIRNNDDEMSVLSVLKNIVNIVLKEISNVPLDVAKHPVGLDEIVNDFEKTVQLADGDQGVQIVGIWGMGGSGKTTLAKELYNKRSSSMEKSSFIFDIRDANDALHKKQVQLLKDFGVIETFDSVNQGKGILVRHLKSFKVLIVMDDVDHVDQLDALLPATGNLGRGSLIIITTREHHVLTSWGTFSVYKMRGLDQPYAEQLFCWHAFLKPDPLNGFEELVKKYIEVCNGLPLSLKVFGAQLYGNPSKPYWESALHKISRILPEDIKERLKINYDSLDDEEKEAFLDSACFFIGRQISVAIEVWDGSGWSGLYTWKKLLNKCLVELDNYDYIRMHDHLRDLGREIAYQHLPSRLCLPMQIVKKTSDIRGIEIAPNGKEEQLLCKEALTPYLAGLKLLVITGDRFNQIMSEVSIEPLWLCWSNIGQRNLPPRLSLKNMRVLQLSESHNRREHHFEELWEAERDAPLQLRELVISCCKKFQRFPNSIGCLNELKKIVIEGTDTIESLPESFCRLQQLEHLELKSCKILSLPSRFGDLTNLRFLDLSWCTKLKNFPISFKYLIHLQHLRLHYCTGLIFMSDDFQNIKQLEFLDISCCVQLEELPRHITYQASLRMLNLGGVERLREVPIEIGQLGRLRKLRIGSDLLISLPYSLGDLSFLTHLKFKLCSNLKFLPNSLGRLSCLTHLTIKSCPNLESLPTSLAELFSLTNFVIWGCPKLRCLPFSVASLPLLENLEIMGCPISQIDFGTASLSFPLSNLKQVNLWETEVFSISISEDCYPRLESLYVGDNDHLTQIEALPVSLDCLILLRNPQLAVLRSFARLTSLRELEVRGSRRIEKVEGLKDCTGLEKLCLQTCEEVMLAIEDLERMEKLREMEIGAKKGSVIRSSIQTVKRWPAEITMCTRAVPDASSLLLDSSILSPHVFVVDSSIPLELKFGASEFTFSEPMKLLLNNSSINGNAIMLCFVINCVDHSQGKSFDLSRNTRPDGMICSMESGEGRWAVIGVFTQRCAWLTATTQILFAARASKRSCFGSTSGPLEVEMERILAVCGEEQRLMEALLPLLQSISL